MKSNAKEYPCDKQGKIAVFLDTDLGGDIDDTWALGVLLRSPELNLLGISTVTGDTRVRAKLCLQILARAGHPPVPVGMGPKQETRFRVSQEEWLDGSIPDDSPFLKEDAVSLLAETVRKSESPVTIIGIGPFGNIAEFVRKYPDLVGKCDFTALGGSVYKGYFGSDKPCREYNIMFDQPSAKVALSAPWHSVLLLPLDICGNIVLEGELYQKIKNSDAPMAKMVMENYRVWFTRKKKDIPTFDMHGSDPETRSTLIADAAAVVLAYRPDLAEIRTIPLEVSERGETLVSEKGIPIPTAVGWKNVQEFYQLVTDRLTMP